MFPTLGWCWASPPERRWVLSIHPHAVRLTAALVGTTEVVGALFEGTARSVPSGERKTGVGPETGYEWTVAPVQSSTLACAYAAVSSQTAPAGDGGPLITQPAPPTVNRRTALFRAT